jgi:predicted O-methyltransferase YrrM
MEHFYQNLDGFSSEPEQGELLKTILQHLIVGEELKIAEIGVYKGRGTAMWNVILINEGLNYDYYAIDHFLGSSEHNKTFDYYGTTLENLKPIIDKIKIIKNDSTSESQKYPNDYFDIVYIDASHEYEYVKKDIINWLPKVKLGGIICGDDYTKGWPGVVVAVNEIFGDNINIVGGQQWWLKKNNN